MKKLALLLTIVMVISSLAACGSKTGNEPVDKVGKTEGTGNEDNTGKTKPADFKTFKIGVAEAQASEETVIRRAYYEEYLAPNYNVQFVFSEKLADSDALLAFIENCADSGCDAVISYSDKDVDHMAQVAAEYGMLYMYNGPAQKEAFAAGHENLMGSISGSPKKVAELFYEYIVNNASKTGEEGFMILSGYASQGNSQSLEITTAVLNALADVYKITFEEDINDLVITSKPLEAKNDKGINVYIYPGDSKGQTFLPGFSAALQTGNYGMILGAGQIYSDCAVAVSEVEQSLDKNIKVASLGSMGDALTKAFETKDIKGNPSLDFSSIKSVSLLSGTMFAMMYNGLTGYTDVMRDENGHAITLQFLQWPINSAEQLKTMEDWDKKETGLWIADKDYIDSLLGLYNPKLTPEQLQSNVEACDFENTLIKLLY